MNIKLLFSVQFVRRFGFQAFNPRKNPLAQFGVRLICRRKKEHVQPIVIQVKGGEQSHILLKRCGCKINAAPCNFLCIAERFFDLRSKLGVIRHDAVKGAEGNLQCAFAIR